MHQSKPRLQALLRREDGPSPGRYGATPLPQWIQGNAPTGHLGIAVEMEIAANNFRQLDERSLSPRRSRRLHSAMLRCDAARVSAHFSGPNKATGTSDEDVAEFALGTKYLDGHEH